MSWVDNMRITVKVFFAPLFAVLGIVTLTWVGFWAMQQQEKVTSAIATVAFPRATLAEDLARSVQNAHMELYQMLAWRAAGVSVDIVASLADSFRSRLQTISDRLAVFEARFALDDGERAELERIFARLETYRPFAIDTVEMAQVQFSDAVTFLWTAHLDYDELIAALDRMADLEAAKADEAHALAVDTSTQTQQLFLGIAAATLILSTLLSLFVGRRIAGSVRHMAAVVRQLANGDTAVPVPYTQRRDEIGSIARAVEVFKQSAIREAEHSQALAQALQNLRLTQSELIRSEKLAALGGMVASVAHEINTPVGNALTVSTTLSDKANEFRDVVQGEKLRRSQIVEFCGTLDKAVTLITGNLHRAAELVGSFKRVAVDQTSESRRRFDLAEVTGEVVAMIRPAHKHSSHRLSIAIPAGVRLDSYPGIYGQVITNLINNAYIHAFEGREGGSIRVALTAEDDETVALVVADDGTGIPPEHLQRIFDPFFTTKFGKGGSGLGLHLVYVMVTRTLGGRIDVTSTADTGTAFTVTLARTAPAAAPREETEAA